MADGLGDQIPVDEVETAAARLQKQMVWGASPNLVAAVLLIIIFWRYDTWFGLVTAILCLANFVLSFVAYRRAGRLDVVQGAFLEVAILWFVGLATALAGPLLLGITVLVVVLALVSVAPFVSPHIVLRWGALSAAIVGVAALSLHFGAPLSVDSIPRTSAAWFVLVGSTVLTAVIGLTVWHTQRGLSETIRRLHLANESLSASERELELEIERRTAELEQRRSELTLARDLAVLANARQATFLANVSHELRTPLNAIIGFSEVLGDELFGPLNTKQGEYVHDVHESGRHLLSLINDVLDLTKVDSGDVEVIPAPVDLQSVVENAVVLMRERALDRGVALDASIEPGLGVVIADERKLKQVLINLLSNAVKFTPATGRVHLEASASGRELRLAVSDTGVGIREEQISLIFEEFGQTEAARGVEGTGLGLALSRRIAVAHGGDIEVSSIVGEGSTFVVVLPNAIPERVS